MSLGPGGSATDGPENRSSGATVVVTVGTAVVFTDRVPARVALQPAAR